MEAWAAKGLNKLIKEVLKILNVTSSGLDSQKKQLGRIPKTDEELLSLVNSLNNDQKESSLRKIFDEEIFGFLKSRLLLATLVKNSDPGYSCKQIRLACISDPLNPLPYLLFAEVASEKNALLIAKEALEIAIWLSNEKEINEKAKALYKITLKKIEDKTFDNSNNDFWFNKTINKSWVFELLLNQGKIKQLIKRAYDLFKIYPVNFDNHYIVLKNFSFLSSKKVLKDYIDFINSKSHLSKSNKKILTGIANYFLSDFIHSIEDLKYGIEAEPLNPKALHYLALNHLLNDSMAEMKKAYERIIPGPEMEHIALYFIVSALDNLKIGDTEYPNQKNIAKNILEIFDKILENNKLDLACLLIARFKSFDYFKVLSFLPIFLLEELINPLFIKKNVI